MFNKFFLVFFSFILLISFTFSLKVVSPVSAEVFDNASVELGKISPGQNFELIVFDEKFNSIEVSGPFSEWSEEPNFYEKNIGIKFNVPFDASLGTKNISLKVFNSANPEIFDSFSVLINVQNDLWSVNISDLIQETKTNSETNYSLVFSNESIGEQKIIVSSFLPVSWMKEKSFVVKPKSTLKKVISVYPKHYGQREFDFIFRSEYSEEIKKFHSRLLVESSLPAKFSSVLDGFPFFTPTLFPYYLIESFFGFFLK